MAARMNLLSEIEVRVLGALIEKDITTPDYYPLSLNALVNACNQKNNRDPVMRLDEEVVRGALDSLQGQRLAGPASGATAGSRSMNTGCRRCSTLTGGRWRSCAYCCCVGRRLRVSCEDEPSACTDSKRWMTCMGRSTGSASASLR